jgi:hypothetical protein
VKPNESQKTWIKRVEKSLKNLYDAGNVSPHLKINTRKLSENN